MEHARDADRLSERHACWLLGQWRGIQRYEPMHRTDEDGLTRANIEFVFEPPGNSIALRRVCQLLQIFLVLLTQLGITHRRTAYHHPEGNSYIERFHRSLKEEEVWTAEYPNLDEARSSIACWIEEYNHDRPHRGVGNRSPHEAFLAFTGALNPEALTV